MAESCNHCDARPGIQVSPGEGSDLLASFELVTTLRSGARIRCPKCRSHWYQWMEGDRAWMACLSTAADARLDAWNSRPLAVSSEQLAMLQQIRGVEVNDHLDIPCMLVQADGTRHDQSFVRFSRMPPLDDKLTTVWITDVQQILDTPVTLPAALRLACTEAGDEDDEAQTPAQTPHGSIVILTGHVHFFTAMLVPGKHLRRTERTKWSRADYAKATLATEGELGPMHPPVTPVYAWADWIDACDDELALR